jgi:carbamate kinase
VSRNDPAFKKPNKPIGPAYNDDGLREARMLNPASVFSKVGPGRYRRVVASPDPLSVSGCGAVGELVRTGYVVITGGGGGVPVAESGRKVVFVDAVVDKDLTSERLATSIGASKLLILTDVEGAYLHYFGKKVLLKNVTAREMKGHLKNGEFEEGSMAPKVRAAVRFSEHTGNSAIICSLARIDSALSGKVGTIVSK